MLSGSLTLGCKVQDWSWWVSEELPLAHRRHRWAGPSPVEGPKECWLEGQGLLPLVPSAQTSGWIHQVQADTHQHSRDILHTLKLCKLTISTSYVNQSSILWGLGPGCGHRGDNRHKHERRETGRVLLLSGKYNLVQPEVPLQWWVFAS